MQRIGADSCGTETEIVALDDAGGERLRRREPTPHGADDHAVQSLASAIPHCQCTVRPTAGVAEDTNSVAVKPASSLAEGFRRAVLTFLAKERAIADALRTKKGRIEFPAVLWNLVDIDAKGFQAKAA